jgi:hypothetical protein
MTWRRMQQQQHAFGLVEIPTAIAIGAALASAAAGSAAAIIQSRHAAQTIDYNTDVSEQQAELAKRAGATAEADTREQTARIRASQRAALGDSGVISSEGSPLLVLLDAAAESEVEAQRAKYTGKVAEQGALANIGLLKQQRSQALQGGYIGAGTSLLTGAANVGTAYLYSQPKKTGQSVNPDYSSNWRAG